MSRRVRVALIAGSMYEPLYGSLSEFSTARYVAVEVGFRGDHPTLNAHLASMRDTEYDLVSTHTKYAPSQAHLLAPLQKHIPEKDLEDFYPKLLELATVDGELLGVPRNIDVRLLHYRTDLLDEPPRTWDALFEASQKLTRPPDFYGFAFPGQESGLFGTFFELVEAAGAHLFPQSQIPDIVSDGGRWALGLLRHMYAEGIAPSQVVDWHYDEVHRSFRDGHVAMIGDWPAYYRAHLDPSQSRVFDRFSVATYPIGPSGFSKTYGGSHTFALTHQGATNPDAIDLLCFLTAPERQLEEASRGSVPVRRSVMRQVLERASESELQRWRTLESVIDQSVLIPPKMKCYPEIEAVLWRTLQKAIVGEISEDEALASIVSQIANIVEGRTSGSSIPRRMKVASLNAD
ncbi:extracellular solute-binding protein [Alloacidobacterium dinghuense]|uniref:Extracellular solute-binding protein n=1 Tax=Alloacidobacterium dinghuense TaxID=2763107 RepID=A0A7G8BH67_9BACT|nr:extracellular solute-binding protein [Alloacidobacterium dinghuense]QNI31887.1 extracellular solute-binding protein [Alloacidobacterium dinghuense]